MISQDSTFWINSIICFTYQLEWGVQHHVTVEAVTVTPVSPDYSLIVSFHYWSVLAHHCDPLNRDGRCFDPLHQVHSYVHTVLTIGIQFPVAIT